MQFLAIILLLNCNWWPWLLLPFLILSWLLGWWFGNSKSKKYRTRVESLESDVRKFSASNTGLEKELGDLKFNYDKLDTDTQSIKNQLSDTELLLSQSREDNESLRIQKPTIETNKIVSDSGISNEDHTVILDKLAATEKAYAILKRDLETSKNEHAVALDRFNASQQALSKCEEEKTNISNSLKNIQTDTSSSESSNIVPLVDNSKTESTIQSGVGAYFSEDNLQIIEGVGPKIEGLLKAAGYNTWSDVAGSDISDLQKVLDDAGPRYRIHNPKTWSDQAAFASNNQWEKLIEYQKFLDTGKDNTANVGGTQSKAEKLYFKALGFAAAKPTDLKVVEGIGPKIESLLKEAGVANWADLAATSVQRIQEILTAAGDRYRLADPKTWPKQAELAAAAKWSELKEYQAFLSGGKE